MRLGYDQVLQAMDPEKVKGLDVYKRQEHMCYGLEDHFCFSCATHCKDKAFIMFRVL